ncbi:MAG: UDP-2,3-diacylglucosamine diphosphatase [Balneolales bacterium]
MNELLNIEPEKKYLFISDVHLGGFDSDKNSAIEKDLISMLDYAETMEMEIIILGDLFDYWMEYPNQIPDVAPAVLARFERLHAKKTRTLYITGNHDNWTHTYFMNIGFDVEHECRMININGQRVLLLHGDGLVEKSLGFPRPLLHRMIRNKNFVTMYKRILPPSTGIGITRYYSRINRKLKSNRQPGNPELDTWAINRIKDGHADTVICGHHHKPIFKTLGKRVYMNLGNFFNDRMAGIYAHKSFYPVIWNGNSKTFTTSNMSYSTR